MKTQTSEQVCLKMQFSKRCSEHIQENGITKRLFLDCYDVRNGSEIIAII